MFLKKCDRSILTQTTIQFILGGVVGFIPPVILLSYTWQSGWEFTTAEILISVGFAILCGTLSAIWGQKFLEQLLELMSFLPPI
jgi:hypothetical protein